MKITLNSTNQLVTINGVPVRLWHGTTESGIVIHALITRIACSKDEPRASELDEELQQCHPPFEEYMYPLRMIL
jgi:hypothetical protein